MADTPNEEAQPSASNTDIDTTAEKTPAAKKKTAKKKTASKKIVAKKATKKKVAAPAPTPAAPAPSAPALSASAPQWDDDQEGTGLVGLLIQWGPVLLIIALMLVLDAHTGDDAHASLDQQGLDVGAGEVVEQAIASDAAIDVPETSDPWSFDETSDLTEDSLLGTVGTEIVPESNWLEDPAAFYWGPAILDEFPPAPDAASQ